jgi:hypothetical protein
MFSYSRMPGLHGSHRMTAVGLGPGGVEWLLGFVRRVNRGTRIRILRVTA